MARNRKYRSAVIRYSPAIRAFLLCVLFGSVGIGYVWQKDQIARLGSQIKQRELRLDALKDQNEKLRKSLSSMRSPFYLETRIKELNLGLVLPQANQVWRLVEPARDADRLTVEGAAARNRAIETAGR
jgi:hypothetical protein